MDKLSLIFICFMSWISTATALECYACVNQDSNKDKCTKTTKQCEQSHDTCFSYIKWGATALECYTCLNQDNNWGKCVWTTKQCHQFQDACTSYIRWGVPPYWVPRGDRIHFISKDCNTQRGCEKMKATTRTHCKRDWYNDWACVECCTGDLCNYYVTLGSGTVKATVFTIVMSVFGLAVVNRLL